MHPQIYKLSSNEVYLYTKKAQSIKDLMLVEKTKVKDKKFQGRATSVEGKRYVEGILCL